MTHAAPGPDASADPAPSPVIAAGAGAVAIAVLVFGAAALRAPVAPWVDPDAAPDAPAPASSAAPATPTEDAPAATAAAPSARPAAVAAGPSVYEQRAAFVRDVRTAHLAEAITGLEAMVDADAPALEDAEIRGALLDLVLRVAVVGGRDADRVFDLVANRTGTRGPDLLYALVTTKGGSRAAKRAEDMLRDDALRERGTPAFRVAYDLRATRCGDKPSLFERAAAEGDGRALGQLTLLNQDCRRGWRRTTDCCYPRDPALVAAIDQLRQRVR